NPAERIYRANDRQTMALLSPSEKYDLLMGDESLTMTDALWLEGKRHQDAYGQVEAWMGIGYGWAAASFMLPEPVRPVDLENPDGRIIRFQPADIKALGSMLWARALRKNR